MFTSDPLVMKKRQSVIDVGQRSQLDLVNADVRRNREILTTLRLENTQLNVALQQAVRGQRRFNSEEHFRREEDQMNSKICVLKRSLNSVKGKKEELAREIERTVEETNFTMREGDATLDEGSAIAQKIRALENRLDKCLIKHNEVNAIRRTYESLLERLQQEQAGFDTQLAAMEKTLQNKTKDLTDLNSVAADATKGRETAKAEVNLLKQQILKERRDQRRDIEERRAFVLTKREQLERRHQQIIEKMEKDEERRQRARQAALTHSQNKKKAALLRASTMSQILTDEDMARLQQQREAYNRLKETTGGGNVAEVIAKLAERNDTHAQLQRTVSEADAQHAALAAERLALQTAWDRLVQSNGGRPAGTLEATDVAERRACVRRRVLEEFDAHLSARRAELEAAQGEQEALGQLLLDVDAGVQHLAESLAVHDAPVHADGDHSVGARGGAIADLLRTCEAKLQLMLDELGEGEIGAAAEALARWRGAMPEGNVRVRVEGRPSRDGAERDDADDSAGGDERHGEEEAAIGSRRWMGAGRNAASSVMEDFPENEIHDRHELKMMSIATVERERKKAKKQLQRRSKEEAK